MGRSFGEEGGRLTYGSYLRVPQLLAQQVRMAGPEAHDELLFITIHQAYELWFKLLLHELEDARDRMLAGRATCPGSGWSGATWWSSCWCSRWT
ncbi:tryptophan 2,3-dioxygenase family protein [Catellatospora bangladeshensis]|uniref:tryptophan 2,3-dioxygenase family protein n=1 Tax=Catellatospora bangladeshensis TaxID=310355 RepID=UPI00361AB4A9